ncbi:Retrovirus-related Pol polyprotein from transposon TNT 1-94 [Linum grandiflorum]
MTIPATTSFKLVMDLQGRPLLRGDVNNGLHRIPCPVTRSSPTPRVAYSGVRKSLQGWHQRIAHPHLDVLRRMISTFKLPVTSNKLPPVCEPCQLGKSRRLPFPSIHSNSSKPFDLVYSDVWGPAPCLSLNGYRYFLVFVDDCTKFIWIYFLTQKSEVLEFVRRFHSMIRTQFGVNIKQFQSDWGGEFRPVSRFLADNGVHQRLSCPHTPQQNGAVERRNRIIIEKGLALLAQSALPQFFWEHAFKTATYLHNRTPTHVLAFSSPFHRLYNNPPDYSSLKAFGCLCYPYLRPYNATKIDFRTLPCIFLGYSSSHKSYFCYHFPTSRLYISRHVIFDESIFPSVPPSTSIVPPVSSLPTTFSLLQHTAAIPPTQVAPPISNTLSSSSNSSTSTASSNSMPPSTQPNPPPPPPPPTPPSYQQPTSNSKAKTLPPTQRHYRPAPNSSHAMVTRAATNSLKPKALTVTLAKDRLIEPKTFKQAVEHEYWRRAMKVEFNALMQNCTWSLVPCPANINLVGSKWIYRIKRLSDGTIDCFKARLVAQGFSQEEGVDYYETFIPVVKPSTIRAVLSIAVSKGWQLRQLDINNAFLNGDLTEEVYMKQPRGFEDPHHPTYVCRLRKALYGLKQAPQAWFTKLKTYLTSQGFNACQSDTSLFVHKSAEGTTYVLVYVDDFIITGSNQPFVEAFIHKLGNKFSLKDMGILHHFLELDIIHTPNGVQLSQQHYIKDLITRVQMAAATSVTTPADPQHRLTREGDPFDNPTLFRQTVGSLQYATITRPDITFAAVNLCTPQQYNIGKL